MVQALAQTLGQSLESTEEWFDKAEDSMSLTIEAFAKRVKEYLDKQGKDRRIIFLVDEVGQFIGNDGHLMLNLQTITEDLGRRHTKSPVPGQGGYPHQPAQLHPGQRQP